VPTYLYRCRAPHPPHELEVQLSVDEVDDTLVVCIEGCDAVMRRVYTAPGLVFKGGGWGSKSS
jgi:predicted nucleic acid-binding Zn ribbon protein